MRNKNNEKRYFLQRISTLSNKSSALKKNSKFFQLVFAVLFLGLFFGFSGKASAATYDNWRYSKSHIITGSSTGSLTNAPVQLTVYKGVGTDSGGVVYLGDTGDETKVRADFRDIRFTDNLGNPLKYSISRKTNTYAYVNILIPSLPQNSSVTIYIYYGNYNVADEQSPCDQVFDFCDDFDKVGQSAGTFYDLGTANTTLSDGQTGTWDAGSDGAGQTKSPHNLSIIDWGTQLDGFRYWGYYGLQTSAYSQIGLARSNSLDGSWTRADLGEGSNLGLVPSLKQATTGNYLRWPTVQRVTEGSNEVIYMIAHNITGKGVAQSLSLFKSDRSIDGSNYGKTFTYVKEVATPIASNKLGNPYLWKSPVNNNYYLYYLESGSSTPKFKIYAKSASDITTLDSVSATLVFSSNDLPTASLQANMTIAAPAMYYKDGTYYLFWESLVAGNWDTRVLTSATSPVSGFSIPQDNVLLGDGSACFFPQVINGELHAYYCKYTGSAWTIDHRTIDTTTPRKGINLSRWDIPSANNVWASIIKSTPFNGAEKNTLYLEWLTPGSIITKSYTKDNYIFGANTKLIGNLDLSVPAQAGFIFRSSADGVNGYRWSLDDVNNISGLYKYTSNVPALVTSNSHDTWNPGSGWFWQRFKTYSTEMLHYWDSGRISGTTALSNNTVNSYLDGGTPYNSGNIGVYSNNADTHMYLDYFYVNPNSRSQATGDGAWGAQTQNDTTAPTITSVSSSHNNGSFKEGEIIDVQVAFSENVISTGDITITLDTGGSCVLNAFYSNVASCNYTVGAGQNSGDLNVSNISGTIYDQAGNALTNFAPATNLANNKNIIIDNIAPAFSNISPASGATVSSDDTITFTDSETTNPQCSLDNSHWNDCESSVTNFNDLTGWNSISEGDTFILYLKDTDAASNTGTASVANLTKADTQASVRSEGLPSGALSSDTISTTLSLTTSESATCKYSISSGTAYADMIDELETTNGTTHTKDISSLSNGNSYSYYVRCRDLSSNTNDTDYLITFSIATPNTDENTDDDKDLNIHNVKAQSSENTITITWKTDHNTKSTIKYGINKNLKEEKKYNDKEKKHEAVIKNLLPKTKYYFRINATDSDDNEDSSSIHSIITKPISVSSPSLNTNQISSENENKIPENTTPTYSGNSTPNFCSYSVESGDSLWNIAKKVYGDATAYPQIIEKNKEKYPDIESRLSIGQELIFCDNNQAQQNSGNNSNQQTQSQSQNNQPRPETKTFHWYNPFTWF